MYVNFLASGLYTARNVNVAELIKEAYGSGLRVIGLPDWGSTERFTISAKVENPPPRTPRQPFVKSLLADRFKFAAHVETREGPVYLLVKARANGQIGPLLRPAKGCDRSTAVEAPRNGPGTPEQLPTCSSRFGPTRQSGGNMALRALIINLPRSSVDRPVLDRTGLTGNFDWDLQWENDPTGASAGVSIFSALQEQLGLKLEPGRGPVEVLVIDHVEMPTFD